MHVTSRDRCPACGTKVPSPSGYRVGEAGPWWRSERRSVCPMCGVVLQRRIVEAWVIDRSPTPGDAVVAEWRNELLGELDGRG